MNASLSMSLPPGASTPTPLVRALGYGGLVPFAGLAALTWLLPPDLVAWVALALAGYAALIASFLGGIHWGIAWTQGALGQPVRGVSFGWGVVPSLLAWPGLLMPAYAGLAWLGAVLVLCYLVDRRLYRHAGLDAWLTLRWRLSSVAALSCFIGAGAL